MALEKVLNKSVRCRIIDLIFGTVGNCFRFIVCKTILQGGQPGDSSAMPEMTMPDRVFSVCHRTISAGYLIGGGKSLQDK
jgi:hypothetical protein